MAGEPVQQAFGMFAEIVVGIETLIRVFDPEQVLLRRAEGAENSLGVAGVDQGIAPQLSLQGRYGDMRA